jgi:hypothetical protein
MGSEGGTSPHYLGGTLRGHLGVNRYGTYSCDQCRAVNGRVCAIRFIGY